MLANGTFHFSLYVTVKILSLIKKIIGRYDL